MIWMIVRAAIGRSIIRQPIINSGNRVFSRFTVFGVVRRSIITFVGEFVIIKGIIKVCISLVLLFVSPLYSTNVSAMTFRVGFLFR